MRFWKKLKSRKQKRFQATSDPWSWEDSYLNPANFSQVHQQAIVDRRLRCPQCYHEFLTIQSVISTQSQRDIGIASAILHCVQCRLDMEYPFSHQEASEYVELDRLDRWDITQYADEIDLGQAEIVSLYDGMVGLVYPSD